MIVPMKKVSVIVQSKDSFSAVWQLRSLGVVHVEHNNKPAGKDIASLYDEIALAEKVLGILSEADPSYDCGQERIKDLSRWEETASHIAHLKNRLGQLEEYSLGIKSRIGDWESWGDFDPEDIEKLAEKNIYVRLYQIPAREIKNLPASVVVNILSNRGGLSNCAVISREKKDLPFREVSLPNMGLSAMKKRLAEDTVTIDSIKEHIRRHARYREEFIRIKSMLENELEFSRSLSGMGRSGALEYITGYIPREAAGVVVKAARKEKWGVYISDPSSEDKVPTLIRNPRWISIISPVFKVIDIVPGYRELDISFWFLAFFSVFFGMLIGDAGYGTIFLLITFFASRRLKKIRDRSVFTLFYILSLCAIIWGLLTATFFGQEWMGHAARPIVAGLRDPANIQTLCFFLGALQLSIGHLWRAIRKLPSLEALADIGWAAILWGGFFLAKALILGDAFPLFGKWFFIAGSFMVVLFTRPDRNIIKGIASGAGSLLLNLVNSFTDIVSYIRLFAVGLATVAIADAFNTMAMGLGYGNLWKGIAASLILLIGHTLNIILGPLAVLVHGVRLNVLEFCNHVDIKWSGFSYNPLKEN